MSNPYTWLSTPYRRHRREYSQRFQTYDNKLKVHWNEKCFNGKLWGRRIRYLGSICKLCCCRLRYLDFVCNLCCGRLRYLGFVCNLCYGRLRYPGFVCKLCYCRLRYLGVVRNLCYCRLRYLGCCWPAWWGTSAGSPAAAQSRSRDAVR